MAAAGRRRTTLGRRRGPGHDRSRGSPSRRRRARAVLRDRDPGQRAVRLDPVHLDRGRRTVRVRGKGDKERTVPVGVPALAAVDRWLAAGRPALATAASGPALFLGVRGGRLDPRTARRIVHERLREAGATRDTGRTASVTARRPTCSRGAPACAASRRSSVIPRPRPPRSIRMCRSSASIPAIVRPIPGLSNRPAPPVTLSLQPHPRARLTATMEHRCRIATTTEHRCRLRGPVPGARRPPRPAHRQPRPAHRQPRPAHRQPRPGPGECAAAQERQVSLGTVAEAEPLWCEPGG